MDIWIVCSLSKILMQRIPLCVYFFGHLYCIIWKVNSLKWNVADDRWYQIDLQKYCIFCYIFTNSTCELLFFTLCKSLREKIDSVCNLQIVGEGII